MTGGMEASEHADKPYHRHCTWLCGQCERSHVVKLTAPYLVVGSKQFVRGMSLCAAAAATLALGGCSSVLMNPQGPVAADEKTILLNALAIMLVIVVPTILATLLFAWWFRASNTRARYRPTFAYSGRIELVTWAIPILVILFLGGLTWVGSHKLDPAEPLKSTTPPVNVQVVSMDWKWLFIYPDNGVASVNELVVPAGTPIHLKLTSASVMNTFFVPQLAGMIYTMNGMADDLYLQADKPGVFQGRSAHFSGDGFSDMHFDVRAVSPADFAAWADQTRSAGPSLDEAAYAALARQSANVPKSTYRAVSPDLFEHIVQQRVAPGPGPESASQAPQAQPHQRS
jgi:cytochrome o ubiquinol oxidase subunit II